MIGIAQALGLGLAQRRRGTIVAPAPATAPSLLREDGGHLLLENGSFLLME